MTKNTKRPVFFIFAKTDTHRLMPYITPNQKLVDELDTDRYVVMTSEEYFAR